LVTVIRHDGPIIIGAGLAGLCAALAAAPRATLVVSPFPLGTGAASAWAQGGIAAALAENDAPALHAQDTLLAGDGLSDPAIVEFLTREGPAAVHSLAALGAPFDRDADGRFLLNLEAAHSRARVARVGGDGAGKAILAAVIEAARTAPHIRFLEDARLTGLIQDDNGTVGGVWLDRDSEIVAVLAQGVILATGGLGGLYAVTSNPSTALGEGLGVAALAGAAIGDPEFVQFHPTGLDVAADPAPLASEALRGEGATLVNADGQRFMPHYSGLGELAPRHIVAQAVHAERAAKRGAYLDGRAALGERFPQAFPALFAGCQRYGIDPRIALIPVAPSAHYHMGGIVSDHHGAATLGGLFAAGECASTGVHGANRLASSSLLEAAVFGGRAGRAAAAVSGPTIRVPKTPYLAPKLPAEGLSELRRCLSRDAGVIRDAVGLTRLLEAIDALENRHGRAAPLAVARLIAQAALDRRESRGGHFRADYPDKAAEAVRTLTTLQSPIRQAAE